jgi:hypothetical protein
MREKAKRWVDAAPPSTRLEFKGTKRTVPQNDRMWAMLTDISKQLTHQGRVYSPDRWKAIFMRAMGYQMEFLPTLDGKDFFPYGFHSSDLSKSEMSDLMEFIVAEGAERGVIFHDPETKRGADGIATGPTEARPNAPALQPKPNHAKEIIT